MADYEGQLIRAEGTAEVYLVENGEKRHIISPKAVESAGYNMVDVKDVPAADVEKYATGSKFVGKEKALVRLSGRPEIYYIRGGELHHITSPEEFDAAGFKWEDIVDLEPEAATAFDEAPIGDEYYEGIGAVEDTIDEIIDTVAEPPIPYDGANPYAFDEVLARAAAEEQWVPYYNELLEDYLAEQGVARTRGQEDLARSKTDIEKALSDYLESAGIQSIRNLEGYTEYTGTLAERKARLAAEKERSLEEYGITRERSDQERAAYMEEARIMGGRIGEDERKALEEQGIDVDRILKLKEDYEAKQAEGLSRMGETLQTSLETLGIAGERTEEDLAKVLESLSGQKASFMSSEERAWKEAVEQTQEGFAGRNLFFSGLRGDTLKKMGVERSAVMEDYMRGYGEKKDLAEVTAGRALQDIARDQERLGVEFDWGKSDIGKAIEEYGQAAGWSLGDIDRAKGDITMEAERQRETMEKQGESYERQYGYAMTDTQRQEANMLRQAGYEEADITRMLGTAEREYGQSQEDIARDTKLRQEAASRGIEQGTEAYQRLEEDLVRQGILTQKGIAREQEASILGGVQQRESEYRGEYEAGRELYYLQQMYPEIYGEPSPGGPDMGEGGHLPTPGETRPIETTPPTGGFDQPWYNEETGEWIGGWGPVSAPKTPTIRQPWKPEQPTEGFDIPGPSGGGYFGATAPSVDYTAYQQKKPEEDLYEAYQYPPSTGMLSYYK